MKLEDAAESVLFGESIRQLYRGYRNVMLEEMGFDPDDAPEHLFHKETMRFVNQLCRHLGERHGGDQRAGAALHAWVLDVDEYDAFDSLLCHFEFDGRESVLQRGRVLFPGPLVAHWDDRP